MLKGVCTGAMPRGPPGTCHQSPLLGQVQAGTLPLGFPAAGAANLLVAYQCMPFANLRRYEWFLQTAAEPAPAVCEPIAA